MPKIKGHATHSDVANGLVSLPDKVANDGAHALALAAALARLCHLMLLPVFRRMTLLCSVCADVWWLSSQHATGRLRSSVSMFLAAALQNLAPRMMTVRMGPRRLMTCRAFLCESRLPTHPPVSVNFVVVAVRIQNALAGVGRPEQDPNGLPLNAAGRFLHVVYRKSGTFGARVTVQGKTTNLGVCPDARAAAEAVQTLKRAGKVVRLSKVAYFRRPLRRLLALAASCAFQTPSCSVL